MTILKIDSSITGENSVSRILTKRVVDQLREAGDTEIVERDLVADPIDHLTLPALADSSILDEFLAADTVVIGAPMYNFGLSTQLKAWIDRILIAGKTFRYTGNGPEGLAGGRRVIVALSRGGFYTEGAPMEHLETYLRDVFGFIGIKPEFVHADGIAIGPEQRKAAIDAAFGEVERLAA